MFATDVEHLYNFLDKDYILPDEQKRCKRESRGTKNQLIAPEGCFIVFPA